MGGIQAEICGTHGVPASECFSLHYPDAHKKVGWPAYTTQVNDLVGGFIVTTFPYPLSEHDLSGKGETPTWENRHTAKLRCGYVIAECMTEQDAKVIAAVLNKECYVPQEALNNPGRWRWVEVGYLEGSLRPL